MSGAREPRVRFTHQRAGRFWDGSGGRYAYTARVDRGHARLGTVEPLPGGRWLAWVVGESLPDELPAEQIFGTRREAGAYLLDRYVQRTSERARSIVKRRIDALPWERAVMEKLKRGPVKTHQLKRRLTLTPRDKAAYDQGPGRVGKR